MFQCVDDKCIECSQAGQSCVDKPCCPSFECKNNECAVCAPKGVNCSDSKPCCGSLECKSGKCEDPSTTCSPVGNWSGFYDFECNGPDGTFTMTVNADGTFTRSDGNNGTWSLGAGGAVLFSFVAGTQFTGTFAAGCGAITGPFVHEGTPGGCIELTRQE